MTALVHGEDAARAADSAAEVLFGGDPTSAPLEALEVVAREVPTTVVAAADLDAGLDLITVLTRTGLASSNGKARRLLSQGRSGGQRPEGLGRAASSEPATSFTAGSLWCAKGNSTYHLIAGKALKTAERPEVHLARRICRVGNPPREAAASDIPV